MERIITLEVVVGEQDVEGWLYYGQKIVGHDKG